MSSNLTSHTLNGGESAYRPNVAESLALLARDTQERAQRILETGAAAASYVVYAGACASMARREIASRQQQRIGYNVLQFRAR